MIESATDRMTFLNTDEFGTTSTIVSNSSGLETEIVGIFDQTHFSLEIGTGTVSTSEPQFLCRSQDLNGVVQDDILILDAVEWRITDIQNDGTGFTTLKLHKA